MKDHRPDDKAWKLQRYERKDYRELVDFPVEIVGRDGVVRKYSFEDSIRLYQRRISFASVRYHDTELMSAESEHCRARIEQLRRSYFHRFGWGTPEGQASPEAVFGELAGELAAFLCRVVRSPGRPDVRLQRILATEPEAKSDATTAKVSLWYVVEERSQAAMLLSVYGFSGEAADAEREVFFRQLKDLERVGVAGGDSERLVAFHHTADCGFVLTTRGAELLPFEQESDDDDPQADLAPTSWDEALEMTRRGEYDRSLARCKQILRDQPWHRNAYAAGAMLALFTGDILSARELTHLGVKHFPKDALLLYYSGVTRLRQGEAALGETRLREALDLDPSLMAARAQLVVHLLLQRRYGESLGLLRARASLGPASGTEDRRARLLLDRLEVWLSWRRLVLAGGVVGVVLALAVAAVSVWLSVIPGTAGLTLLGAGWFGFRLRLEALAKRYSSEEISQGLRRLTQKRSASSGAL